tara:strand:+ start:13246 stop:14175 length:930 start_codon:yes stop_codon:yes gene_type:complete
MNIVYSSTKQWNPGDELILDGVRSLIPEEHTFIMFNRHPFINFNNRTGDNSYYHGMGDDIIDYIIFAGSPEYQTFPNEDLYKLIESHETPFCYIGVGGRPFMSRPFDRAEITITRDSNAGMLPNAEVLPCPSIFANRDMNLSPVTKKENIGFCFQTNLRYICAPSENIHKLSVQFIEEYNPLVICHSYPDFVEATRREWNAFYSSNKDDYYDAYKDLDFVVGTRIHGSGWAANFGIPSITIPHDDRFETAQNFGSLISELDYDKLKDLFESVDVEKESKNIIEIRKKALPKYLTKTSPIFGTPDWFKKE